MNIGPYSFDEFCSLAENFHGYAAPGLLIGGYMMAMAKNALPAGTLFEAVVETPKCLPDAVQLLSVCSTGNQRMKIKNLGRYALALFDKYSGKGVRVSLDPEKMARWPELNAWFFKLKPKKEQDAARLEQEIREAGDSICKMEEISVKPALIGHGHMKKIKVCPICGEAYPGEDGPICRGCQGETPYLNQEAAKLAAKAPQIKIVPVEDAVGAKALHDMTRISPGQFKGPEFRAGQRIKPGDVCRLQQMGRFNVAVLDEADAENSSQIHENDVALAFAKRMAGPGITYKDDPREGKIDFEADQNGIFCVDEELLTAFNLIPDVMAASRQDAALVQKGDRVAGARAIPLFLDRLFFEEALALLDQKPLFEVKKLRAAKAGIMVTGTEVFKGLIEDKFIPVITAKLLNLGSEVIQTAIVPDDIVSMTSALREMIAAGVDLIVTTGGMSVDPDDITRQALSEVGLEHAVHGVPVLPGTMSLVGKIYAAGRKIDVLGVPACALYYKTTFLDLILPRVLAGREFSRRDAARMGSGGYCLSCKICTWPKCSFGK